jgi:hypothetical protein
MSFRRRFIQAASLAIAMAAPEQPAAQQATPSATRQPASQVQSSFSAHLGPQNLPLENPSRSLFSFLPEVLPTPQALFDFRDSDIKFRLASLMSVLRDSGHEGWVLAAYPDPKTSRPLIGAGFGLDVTATEHLQRDLLNPHPFLEPSSAQLWQAAGLDPAQLQSILGRFERDLKAWNKKNFRRKIKTHALAPELTEQEAMQLLRISALQAVHNARAYCREFDQLTAAQQMALSQLVFQMGINLEEFVQFLGALNDDAGYGGGAQAEGNAEREAEHWKTVQSMLIQSDWARRYTGRAVTVIAMFNPDYELDPKAAQSQVQSAIHPLVVHHRKKTHARSVRASNDVNHALGRTPNAQ